MPENAADRACGARAVTLADFTPDVRTLRFGATTPAGHRSWSGTRTGLPLDNAFHAFAAEVTPAHVTWFLDGRPVGTAPRAAVPGVPLTVRLSLVGRGQQEMQHTYAGADWVRAWALGGHGPVTGTPVRAGTHTPGC